MTVLSEITQKDFIRALVYGTTGSGKTALAGEMARYEQLRPIYFFDFDLRIASLRATVPTELQAFIQADPFRDMDIQGESWTLAEYKLSKLTEAEFKTVVVDTVTFAEKSLMSRVLFLDGGKIATFTPQLNHYMQAITILEDFIGKLCARRFNIIINCHEDTVKDEVTGRLFKGLDLTGKKAPNRIPGYFNEVWHTEVRPVPGGDPEYVVRTRSDAIYSARTSFKSLLTVEKQGEIWGKIIKEKGL